MTIAFPIWLRLLIQEICLALPLALLRAGSNMAARMAMMAITTRSSMRVNADRGVRPNGNTSRGWPARGLRDPLGFDSCCALMDCINYMPYSRASCGMKWPHLRAGSDLCQVISSHLKSECSEV